MIYSLVCDLCKIDSFLLSTHIEYSMPDLSLPSVLERANLPRNMIENSMFEEEPDVVDLAKDSSSSFPVGSFKDLPFLSGFFYLYEQRHDLKYKKGSPARLGRIS